MVHPPGYAHQAIFVGSDDEMVGTVVPFLREALDADEAVGLACSESTNRVLTDALDHDSRVAVLPHDRVYRDARTAVEAYCEFAAEKVASGSSRVRLLGEVDFPAYTSWQEWALFEAVSEDLLSSEPVWSMCMYDTRTLTDSVLLTGELTHRCLRLDGECLTNPQYMPPSEVLASPPLDAVDPIALTQPTLELPDVHRGATVRHQVRALLTSMAVFPRERVEPFVLAVHEVVGNGVAHGVGPVSLRIWVAGGQTVCTVTDRGRGFPVPAQAPPRTRQPLLPGGRVGLHIVRELVDEFHGYLTDDGFVVRLGVHYPKA